ncbi:NAD(P)/FAD-dependent oxidoreductase [Pseudophaeobacter profundi]|jgi:glycine/D-amino acid oxidase-like deaminating enzyme|uniref:NAD(P)/FAD-dependent oxidoreductase n=1 Tax=Pseudophaeobacter profundi TaxID=3034152 RepID=UPI00242B08D4|nr:FAD-binding oxidoreductase [Pseudophaeobacter profundi]
MPGLKLPYFPADLALPKRVDVVVVGGGIIGASTALELAERGHSVLLCEKGQIAGEQSSRNWGWVRISQRDPQELPLMREALHLWDGLEARTGHPTGYRRSGILFTADRSREEADLERWAPHLAAMDLPGQMLRGDFLRQVMPGYQGKAISGYYTPLDGRAEPQLATHAIARAAQAAGARVMTECAVRSVESEAGRISGVMTERGRVACSAVVVAGGAWSRLFLGNARIALPQLKVLNSVLRTSPVRGGPDCSIWCNGFALRKRQDGGYTIASGSENIVDIVPDSLRLGLKFLPSYLQEWRSIQFRFAGSGRWREEAAQDRRWSAQQTTPFETCRVLDPAPSQKAIKQGWDAAQRAFPVLRGCDVVQSWGGLIDVTPDALPVISQVDDLPGLFISTGYSGHGFGIGPAAGRLTADLVTGDAPIVDPHGFRLSRFSKKK